MKDATEAGRKRSSLSLLAEISSDGKIWTVRVRNVSAGGLMAEPCKQLVPGDLVRIELRNAGQIGGKVAWVNDPRFGIAFDRAIDHSAVTGTGRPSSPSKPTVESLPLRRI